MFGRLARGKLLSKKAWQHGSGLQSCIWTDPKSSRTMTFEQMRPKWRCLAIMHSSTFGENLTSISAQTPHTKSHTCWWRADDFGACFVATGPRHLTVIESTMNSFPKPKYSRVKCEDIRSTAKAWPRLGDATGQWSHSHQQIYNRMSETKRINGL